MKFLQTVKCNRATKAGFTLLELVLALLLVALLIGMVFSTSRSSLVLGNTVVKTQNEEMLQQAFIDFLENQFHSLPGNARMELKVNDAGTHYLSDLTLQNIPMNFTWGGGERTAKAIQLSTIKRRSGFLDIVLKYYDEEMIEGTSSLGSGENVKSRASASKPFAEMTLLSDVAYFEWKVIDGRNMEEPRYDWNLPSRLPLQMELRFKIGKEGQSIRHIFWIPQKMKPEGFLNHSSNQDQPPNGNPNGGGNGDIKIELNAPAVE